MKEKLFACFIQQPGDLKHSPTIANILMKDMQHNVTRKYIVLAMIDVTLAPKG